MHALQFALEQNGSMDDGVSIAEATIMQQQPGRVSQLQMAKQIKSGLQSIESSYRKFDDIVELVNGQNEEEDLLDANFEAVLSTIHMRPREH